MASAAAAEIALQNSNSPGFSGFASGQQCQCAIKLSDFWTILCIKSDK